MKCISCGNEIPNTSTACPFCGKEVTPIEGGVTPTYAEQPEQDFSVNPLVTQESTPMPAAPVDGVPATPESPVLPQDQGLPVEPVAPAVPVGNEVSPESATIPPIPGSEAETPKMPAVDPNPPVVSATSGVITNNEPTPPAPPELDGVKESSSAIVEADKKKAKNKKLMKIVIIVLVLLLIIGGGAFGYVYYTQTQTAAKRINTLIDQVLKFDGNTTEALKTASGKYNFSGEISVGDQGFSGSMSGIYAYDLEKKIIDYTLNLEKLNVAGTELIDKEALNVELYYADSNIYILLQNFFDKYIYTEVTGMEELLDNISKNDIDNLTILNGMKAALKASINSLGKKQAVKDIEIGDVKTKANVITITLNKEMLKNFVSNFLNNIANNENLLKELAKLDEEYTADKIKEQIEANIDEIKKNIDDSDSEFKESIEIYTAMFGEEFYGLRITDLGVETPGKVEVYKVDKGYKIILSEGKNEILNLTYTCDAQKSKDNTETTYGLDVIMNSDGEVLKIKGEFKDTRDVNPKVERVNTKESVNVENLTEADLTGILEKISNFGNLGLLVQSLLTEMQQPTDTTTSIVTPSTDTIPMN